CFGKAVILEGDNKQKAMEMIVEKYSADFKEKGLEMIKAKWDRTAVVCVEIEHMTGKGMAR
ncbi:MAG: 5-nitroimidazole antibiotic resistance protein, partial [Firmicutes bacterium]|nr:5-nitroimidazole antibiotic resistance protein [Bacillota bacterium]